MKNGNLNKDKGTASEYARRCGVDPSRVTFLCRSGFFGHAATKLGKRWEINFLEADKKIAENLDIAWNQQAKLNKPAPEIVDYRYTALCRAAQTLGEIEPRSFKKLLAHGNLKGIWKRWKAN